MRIFLLCILGTNILFALVNKVILIKSNESNESIVLNVQSVSSYKEKVKGLSGVKSLKWNKGMLFEYKKEQRISIWMKDMLIPLDIIFLSKNKKVRLLIQNIQPCKSDNCQIYIAEDTQYIIEVRAGYIKKYSVSEGSVFQIRDKAYKAN